MELKDLIDHLSKGLDEPDEGHQFVNLVLIVISLCWRYNTQVRCALGSKTPCKVIYEEVS